MNEAAPMVEAAVRKKIQYLGNTPALRTALRRACASAGGLTLLSQFGELPRAGVDVVDENVDVVVLDATMPGVRGLTLLKRIKSRRPDVVVVVVAPDDEDSEALRSEALSLGAVDVIPVPHAENPLQFRPHANKVVTAIKSASSGRRPAFASPRSRGETPKPRAGRVRSTPPKLVVVGSSTGGPQALINVFKDLDPKKVAVPVLIVQHMPAAFTPILAEHLTRATRWRAAEASHDEPLTTGEIRIAPGGYHMEIAGRGTQLKLRLTEDPPVNFCRPSADVLFASAATHYGSSVLGVILTGMGNDGAQGASLISAAGGSIYVQDKETSVVWGMPGAAVAAGVVDRMMPLSEIASAVSGAVAGGVR